MRRSTPPRVRTMDAVGVSVENCFNPRGTGKVTNVNPNVGNTNTITYHGPVFQINNDQVQIPYGEKTSPTEQEDARKQIESWLRDFYSKVTLPTLPWLVEERDTPFQSYVQLQLKSVCGQTRIESDSGQTKPHHVELDELFDSVNDGNPRRILIESQPGFGKTTLAHKIVHDWANGKHYVKRFTFAILIILKYFKSETLKDEVAKIIDLSEFSVDEIWDVVNREETLLILDGLDEMSDIGKDSVVDSLYGSKMKYRMAIVVTCRIGFLRQISDKVNFKFGGVSVRKNIWCKKVTILGISGAHRNIFLNNFVQSNGKNRILERLGDIIRTREVMFESPLMLTLLVYLLEDNNDIAMVSTTYFYKHLVDCIYRRSINKSLQPPTDQFFSLFDQQLDSTTSTAYKMFCEFGKIYWERDLKHVLSFDFSDDIERIYEFGFLVKRENHQVMPNHFSYKAIDISILEFAAAVYLKEEFQRNDHRFTVQVMEKINEIYITKKLTSMIVPFLCGLLGDDVVLLFDQLSHYHGKFWFDERIIESILKECKLSAIASKHLSKIVPPHWNSEHSFFTLATAQQNLMPLFDIVETDMSCLSKATNPVHFRVVHCNQFNENIENWVIETTKKCSCDVLIYDFFGNGPGEIMANYLKMFASISAKRKIMRLQDMYGSNYASLADCASKGFLNGVELDLVVRISGSVKEMVVISNFVSQHKIATLTLIVYSPTTEILVDSVVDLVVKSPGLTSLRIVNEQRDSVLCLNLDIINDNGIRDFEHLLFYNICLECKAQCNSNYHTKSMSIIDNLNCVSTLASTLSVFLSLVPREVQCCCKALRELSKKPNELSWAGWDSITQLTFTIDDLNALHGLTNFVELHKFKNLKMLTLEIAISPTSTSSFDVRANINILKCIELEQLEIRWSDIGYFNDILCAVQDLFPADTSIKNISLVYVCSETSVISRGQFNLEPIKAILKCNFDVSFKFVFYKWKELRYFFATNIRGLSDFNVKYSYAAEQVTQTIPLTFRRRLREYTKDLHIVELTLR